MEFVKRIHPSATLFVGILVAFTLPFGYSAEACGPRTQEYRGTDLLVAHVEPDGDLEYAAAVSHRGLIWSWLLLAATLLGLRATVLNRGRRWATWCVVAATLAFVLGVAVIEAGEPRVGWFLALGAPTAGVVLKILIAFGRWIWRHVGPRFAPAVTTPGEGAVR